MSGIWLTLLGILVFWIVVYIVFRGRSGDRVQVLPFALIIRAGISLDPMEEGRLSTRMYRVFGVIGIFVMAYLAVEFFRIIGVMFAVRYLGFRVPGISPSEAGVTPLIPGVTIPWSDLVYVFIGIGIAALFHEMAHAYIARAEGLRVKDAGLAFILFFPAAFVEPDEEELKRAPLKSRLSVYAAGVTANMAIFLILSLAMSLLLPSIAYGVALYKVEEGSPAFQAGLRQGMVIVEANGVRVKTLGDLARVFQEAGITNPNTSASVTLKVEYKGSVETITVVKPNGTDKIGITIIQAYRPQALGVTLHSTMFFNFMLALINAAPLAIPLPGGMLLSDGGHALRDALQRVAGRRGELAASIVNLAVFIVILSLMTLNPVKLTP